MANLIVQLQDYRLTTAEITYRMPDWPRVLQTYLWQEYDVPPQFPRLMQFLEFWNRELDGALHSVRVASAETILPGEVQHFDEGKWLQ